MSKTLTLCQPTDAFDFYLEQITVNFALSGGNAADL
jgi:hypothetical protein